MGFRKIIGFGDSSFVVSLPKDWVTKNGLKKGDVVSMDEDENSVKISPGIQKQTSNINEIKINFEGNIKKLKTEILYAYINNYSTINIIGDNLHNSFDSIVEITKDFMFLDIVDSPSSNKLVLTTSINLYDVSIYDTLRRMDRIVLSMAEDLKSYLSGKVLKIDIAFNNKETNVNKLCNLVFKTLKSGFNSNNRTILNLHMDDIFYYWELALFIEKTADQLKRVYKAVKSKVPMGMIGLLDLALLQYSDAMKANFTKDHKLAISVITKKKMFYDEVDKLLLEIPVNYVVAIEKIGNINNYAGNIAKALLRLKMDLGN